MNDRIGPGHLVEHEELAVGWALHTLEPEDEARFVLHLADCEHCGRTVAETEETLGTLGAAVTPVDPPPRLRERLMAAVADDTAMPTTAGEPAPGDATASEESTDEGGGADVVPLAPRRRRLSRLVLAAAVALVVAAVGGLAVANQELRSERDAQVAAAAQNAPVLEVLRDAGTPGVPHASLADPQGALVGLVVDTGTGPRVLTTGLDTNRSDQIYVLWGLAGDRPTALGTFDVSGRAPVVTSVPSTPETVRYAGFAVSLEPGRTAPVSPTEIVASGQVGR